MVLNIFDLNLTWFIYPTAINQMLKTLNKTADNIKNKHQWHSTSYTSVGHLEERRRVGRTRSRLVELVIGDADEAPRSSGAPEFDVPRGVRVTVDVAECLLNAPPDVHPTILGRFDEDHLPRVAVGVVAVGARYVEIVPVTDFNRPCTTTTTLLYNIQTVFMFIHSNTVHSMK